MDNLNKVRYYLCFKNYLSLFKWFSWPSNWPRAPPFLSFNEFKKKEIVLKERRSSRQFFLNTLPVVSSCSNPRFYLYI